jgi:hypothetical protein
MNNKKVKNMNWEGGKLRSWKYKRYMKSIGKIHEVAKGKGPLVWNWGVPHMSSRFRRIMNYFKKFHEIGKTL